MDTYSLYAIVVDDETTPAVLVDQIQSQDIDPALTELIESGDGAVDDLYAAVGRSEALVTFETTAIAAALAAAGIDGYAITDEIQLHFRKNAEDGTRATGSNHLMVGIASGMIIPTRFTAQGDQASRITMQIVPRDSAGGGTNPITVTASQPLTGSPTVDELFVVGPGTFNGTALNNVQSLDIDFGINVHRGFKDGHAYPTHNHILSRRPSITVGTNDAAVMVSPGLSGTAISSTTEFYLRKVAEGAVRVADATAEHIKFVIAQGRLHAMQNRGQQGQVADFQLKATPTYDGSNDVVAINTATAIT